MCQGCHTIDGVSSTVQVSDGFIRSQQQANEFMISQHGNGDGVDLQCGSCHNPHIPVHYPEAAGAGRNGISTTCQTCHPAQPVLLNDAPKPIQCIDCHMPKATKSALGGPVGNGLMGDVATHIFSINPAPVTREAMFAAGGTEVTIDASGLATGVYLYELRTGAFTATRTMVVSK